MCTLNWTKITYEWGREESKRGAIVEREFSYQNGSFQSLLTSKIKFISSFLPHRIDSFNFEAYVIHTERWRDNKAAWRDKGRNQLSGYAGRSMSTQMGGRGEGTGEERDLDRKAHTDATTAQNHNSTESQQHRITTAQNHNSTESLYNLRT